MAVRAFRLDVTFDALRNRDFRWLWLGRLASSATFEMGTVVQGWLVYYLTGSAFALGWVGSGWSIATLSLSLYGGALCDRMDKRTLLLWSRVAMFANSLIVGLLVSLDVIQVWHLAASSLFTGVLFAFMMPAQQAIISDIVDQKLLLNAVSLNAVGMGLMGIFCASLAGLIIESMGAAGVYYAMAAFYLLAVFTITKLPRQTASHAPTESVWKDLADGVRYLRVSPVLLTLLGMALVRVLFAMGYRTLMPAFARDNLGFDARGLGLLMSAPGVGSLIASLIVCSRGNMRGKGKLLLTAGIVLGLGLVLFVTVPFLPAVFVILAIVGALNMLSMVMNNTLIQIHTNEAYRGRVMSVYLMMWGLTPLGTLPAGAIADRVGVPPVIIFQGLAVSLIFIGILLLKPQVKTLD